MLCSMLSTDIAASRVSGFACTADGFMLSGATRVPSLRFAARFDSDRSSFEQLQRDVKERCPVAALELKLDLADRLNATAIGSPNVSHVECGLNSSGRLRLELDYRPRDRPRFTGAQRG